MDQILDQKKAASNFLQASEGDVNIVIPFSNYIMGTYVVENSTQENLEGLYHDIRENVCYGGTDIYKAAVQGLEQLKQYDLSKYTPAIILMTDGKSNGQTTYDDFIKAYEEQGVDVPVFSIMFGSAKEQQLEQLAEATNAKVFDGTEDLIQAFRSVKGYN